MSAAGETPRQVAASLEALDGLDADLLLLFLYEGELPLRGLAGLVDWRLAGRLSAWVQEGWLGAGLGERLLTTGAGRLAVGRIVAVGAGPRKGQSPAAVEAMADEVARLLVELKARSVALALPGDPAPSGDTLVELVTQRLRTQWEGPITLLRAGDDPLSGEA